MPWIVITKYKWIARLSIYDYILLWISSLISRYWRFKFPVMGIVFMDRFAC